MAEATAAEVQPSSPVSSPVRKAAPPKKKKEPAEVVARCGGYVDRGDGNGWVLEEE